MAHRAAVPFNLRRSEDVFSAATVTSTTEVVHGLLLLEGERLVIQWRRSRTTESVGGTSIRTDSEVEAVREIVLPLSAVAGASVRRRWWDILLGPRLVLRAADLRAFEEMTGAEGLKLAHPAEIILRLRGGDALLAEEFAAELTLALAERALGPGDPGSRRELPSSREHEDAPAAPEDPSASGR